MSARTKSTLVDPALVAARIKAERNRLGLSVGQCGEMLGVDRTSYYELEKVGNPQYARLVELIQVLGFDLKTIAPELFPPARRRKVRAVP